MRVRHILLAATLCLAVANACHARTAITLRSDYWCPYNCTPGSDHPGYAVEIAQIVFNDAGYDVDYQQLNWTRSIDEARQGHADAVIGAITSEVPGFVIPAQPIGHSHAGFAARAGSGFRYTGPQSLDGRVLGLVAEYAFPGELGDYLQSFHGDKSRVQYIAGDRALQKNLLKLAAGRVDVVIDDAQVLRRMIGELQLSDRLVFSQRAEHVDIYIAFSPARPDSARYAEILSAGIARLRASGRLAAILARYGLQDWNRDCCEGQDAHAAR